MWTRNNSYMGLFGLLAIATVNGAVVYQTEKEYFCHVEQKRRLKIREEL